MPVCGSFRNRTRDRATKYDFREKFASRCNPQRLTNVLIVRALCRGIVLLTNLKAASNMVCGVLEAIRLRR